MRVFTAQVTGGVIVLEDSVTLPEGTVVTVIADLGANAPEFTPEEEAELAESIREAEAGQVITAHELLERLRR